VNEKVSGLVDKETWNYYHYTANTNFKLVISLTQTMAGDCDLYVRMSERDPPSRFEYDYQEISPQTSVSIEIPDAHQNTLQIGVFGWEKCTYDLTLTLTAGCPGNCNSQGNHGACTAGTCVCAGAWVGDECQYPLRILTSGVKTNTTLNNQNDWVYYRFTSTSTTLVISLKERMTQDAIAADNTFSALELFVQEGSFPTRKLSDYAVSTTDLFKSVTISLDDRPKSDLQIDWYIGVYTSSSLTEPVTYDLMAWQPPF
jgi:hypothetical protein